MTRVPSLDGLRGLAILLVVASHLGLPVLDFGGPAGVTLFFVLSGYLITGILTRQADEGRIRFAEFYWRRARRLLPALILAVAVGAAIFYKEDIWSFSWPALTYTSSFIMAAEGGRTLGYLSHTWSLAVEEHFYLLWPAVIALIPARHRVKGIAILACTAVLWRVLLWVTEPIHRVLFSTDGNAGALLVGCLLAVIASRLPAPNLRIGTYAVGSLVAVSVLPFVPVREPLTFLVIGLSAIAVHSAPAIRILEAAWLRWFGAISYALYLWHPILYGMSTSWLMAPLAVLVAWLSWRLLEEPILNGGSLRRITTALAPSAGKADPVSP